MGIAQLGRQNAAPKKASHDTEPVPIGACAATKLATREARSRIVPSSGAIPNNASAHRVQRRNDAHRVADDGPIVLAVLVRERTDAAHTFSYAQSASAAAIAEREYR